MATLEKGVPYDFYWPLNSISGEFISSPVIEEESFKVSIDGNSFVPLIVRPIVTPPDSGSVKISLSAIEMTGEKIVIRGIDPNNVWREVFVFIDILDPVGFGISDSRPTTFRFLE